MATKIKFDRDYNLIEPTVILSRRNGDKLGRIPASDLRYARNLNKADELRFTVYKEALRYTNSEGKEDYFLWDDITDFKLVYLREYDEFFELYVEVQDDNNTLYKNCNLISLAEAELSQININMEFNTEDDIALDDYEPRVIYNKNKNESILSMMFEKAPHYSIGHVDTSIYNIQRTFTFNTNLYDCLQSIAEEVECIFIFDNGTDSEGKPKRIVNVYDLKNHCIVCDKRGEFTSTCPECGGVDIAEGYGEDTTVYIDDENLASSIVISSDTDSVKNCFSLEAGDDLFTATLRTCNPNGSAYIWNITDYMKQDMSPELVSRLAEYDELYAYYLNEYQPNLTESLISDYNALVDKYKNDSNDLTKITTPIVGYTALMQAYYQTIDFYLYLYDVMMPEGQDNSTTAEAEGAKLTASNMSPVAVSNINAASIYTVENAVKGMARALVDQRYKVSVESVSYENNVWNGYFIITSYTDDEDTCSTSAINVTVNGDYETYVKQKINIMLGEKNALLAGVSELFKLGTADFVAALNEYGVVPLQTIDSCCQSCLDILIMQGVADEKNDLYSLYLEYYNRKEYIENELSERSDEVAVIAGKTDSDGDVIQDGVQTEIEDEIAFIQDELNFSAFLGDDLWIEFSSFRRDDVYSNTNFSSDGLTTSELFEQAKEFMELAKRDILKSSTLQHSINSSMQNLLAIKEFEPLKDYFDVGNWLRVKMDGDIYKLRLIHFETNFKDQLDVDFSDVVNIGDAMTDVEDILNQAQNMATSYDVVKRQAKKGDKTNSKYNEWVTKGLALTQVRIVNDADNQDMSFDEHGLLGREYNPITGDYDDKQLKIINKGVYFTSDNWKTARAAVGNFVFWNPATDQIEETYGVIADTLVGSFILSEDVGIYTVNGNFQLNEDGFKMVCDVDEATGKTDMQFSIVRRETDGDNEELTDLIRVNEYGDLIINANSLKITVGDTDKPLDEYVEDTVGDTGNVNDDVKDSIVQEAVEEAKGYSDGLIRDKKGNKNYLRDTRRMTGWIYSNLYHSEPDNSKSGWDFGDTDLDTNYIFLNVPDGTSDGIVKGETVYTMPGITYNEIVNSKLTLSWDVSSLLESGKEEPDSSEKYSFTFYRVPRSVAENAADNYGIRNLYTYPHSDPLTPDNYTAQYLWERKSITFEMNNDLFTIKPNAANLNDVILLSISCNIKTCTPQNPYLFRKFKLEKGGYDTDWQPAQEDADAQHDKDVSDLTTRIDSCATIEVTEAAITSSVEEVYRYVDEQTGQLTDEIATAYTKIEQTSDKVETVVKSVDDIYTHFSFTSDGFYINKDTSNESDNPNIYMFMDNDSLSFIDSNTNTAVAQFTERQMLVTEAVINTSLSFGNGWAFIPRGNGSMDFKKVS